MSRTPWHAEARALLIRLEVQWASVTGEDRVIDELLKLAEKELTGGPAGPRTWWNGWYKEVVWRSLHAAEARITARSGDLGGRLPEIRARVGAHLSGKDERCKALAKIDNAALSGASAGQARVVVETALDAAFKAADDSYSTLRGHRNRLLGTAVALFVLMVAMGIAIGKSPAMLPLCSGNLCPTGGTTASGGDYWWVVALGLFGALVASVPGVKVKLSLAPYAFGAPLFVLKLLVGAGFAVVGVVAMKTGVVGGVVVTNQAVLIVSAIVFGYSQRVGTQILDSYSKKLVAEAKPSTAEAEAK